MTREFKSKPFYYRLFGDYALFTDPATRGGGEKFSYQVPTYQALKGITEAIYWKPSLYYVIDEVKVVNQIQSETMGARPIKLNGGNDLSYYTYLKNVEYLVKFHFEWNLNRADLKDDRIEKKHQEIFLRSLDRGGRRDLFLGTRECVGFVERLTRDEYESAKTYYDNQTLNFGIMFHSFTYPSEASEASGKLFSNFTSLQMYNGTIQFSRPEDCEIKHEISDYTIKKFTMKDLKNVNDEYKSYGLGGV